MEHTRIKKQYTRPLVLNHQALRIERIQGDDEANDYSTSYKENSVQKLKTHE